MTLRTTSFELSKNKLLVHAEPPPGMDRARGGSHEHLVKRFSDGVQAPQGEFMGMHRPGHVHRLGPPSLHAYACLSSLFRPRLLSPLHDPLAPPHAGVGSGCDRKSANFP